MSHSKQPALFSSVQTVDTLSVVQYCTVQISKKLQWCTVMYSTYQCHVQCGTVLVQCKSVKDSEFSGMSVVFRLVVLRYVCILRSLTAHCSHIVHQIQDLLCLHSTFILLRPRHTSLNILNISTIYLKWKTLFYVLIKKHTLRSVKIDQHTRLSVK